MSKIEKELVKATGVEAKKGEARPEFLARMAKAVAGLDEKDWEDLSAEAQDWYNANADARQKAKKAGESMPPYTDFADAKPDVEEEEDDQPSRRRRGSDEDKSGKAKENAPPKGEATAVEKLEEGQRVKIVTKRGKEVAGEVVENSKRKEYVVVKTADGKEEELDYDRVDSVEVFHGTAGTGGDAGDEDKDVGPGIGDEVELTNKRGKTFRGKITELSEEEIVIETDDGPEDFARDRITDIKVTKKAKAGGPKKEDAKGDDEKATKGKGTKKDDDGDDKKTRSRSSDEVPIGTKIKIAIAENLDADVGEIAAILKKAGVEVKENTLDLNFKECHKLLKALHERDLLAVKKFTPKV
jgi:ribosome maturation factor RimP